MRSRTLCVAAAWALAALSRMAPAGEGDPYEWWNKFCIQNFGAEKEPLVYDLFGKDLKMVEGGAWVHASEISACVAWETNLPAKTVVEYGESPNYGAKTPEPERPFYIHVHYLRDLKPGVAYHYRLVSVDERGNKVVSPDMTLKTEVPAGAVRVPEGLAGPPYKLDKPGAYYVLTKDVTSQAGAFEVIGDDITLDLGGHTVTFGQDAKGDCKGIDARGGEKTRIRYQASKLRLVNGVVVQGASAAAAANKNSEAFNCLYLVGAEIELAGVTLDYRAPQAWGGIIRHPSGAIDVHHNVFIDRGTEITDRHGMGVRPFGFSQQPLEKNAFRIHHNLVKRTRQNGLAGAWELSHNEIGVDSWSTNSFALQPRSVPDTETGDVAFNRVFATGFNPYGLGWAHLRLKVHDNLVHMHGIDAKSRWGERWGDISTCEGFRVTNYGKGGQVRKDLEYWRNLIVIRGVGGSELRGTGFYSDETITDLVFHDNIVKVESLDQQTDQVASIACHGHVEKADTSLPVTYRDCRLASNICNVRFGDSYGKGSNHRFIGCTLIKTGSDPRYHTFMFDGAYWCKRNVIQDCLFEGGARFDDVFWKKTGSNSFYDVRWTLTIKAPQGAQVSVKNALGEEEFTGAVGADGTLAVPLDQCRITPPDGFKGGEPNTAHKTTAKTPHAVTVTAGGKAATLSVEMTRKRWVELKGGALSEYEPAPAPARPAKEGAKPSAGAAQPADQAATTQAQAPRESVVADAEAARLYRSARDAERSGLRDVAKKLWERLATEYPDSPLAGEARKKL